MKHTYSKPQIMFEDFSLSVSIASCEVETHLPSKDICGLQYGPNVLFNSTISACTHDFSTVEQYVYTGLCYHNPSENYNLFSS